MRPVPPQLIGINVNELSRICHVSLKTAARWKSGTTCPPESALLLLRADLGCFSPEWTGWRLNGQDLISPEGWRIARGQVMIVPLMRQQIAAYEVELKRLRAEVVLTHDQPVPSEWPEWIKELEVG
jgi:Phage protein